MKSPTAHITRHGHVTVLRAHIGPTQPELSTVILHVYTLQRALTLSMYSLQFATCPSIFRTECTNMSRIRGPKSFLRS
jgi:hypothetical protein